MAGVIRAAIIFALSSYSLTFMVTGLLFSILAIARAKKPIGPSGVVERLLSWHVFWAIGVGYLYNFVMHGFFGGMSAAYIGWADSPFQFEVATASLGFAVVGFLAAFRSFDLRLAAIVGPGVFTLGAAAGHIRQMVTEHNFAPGNAGVIFYMDIIIPLFGLLMLWLQHHFADPGVGPVPSRAAVPSGDRPGYSLRHRQDQCVIHHVMPQLRDGPVTTAGTFLTRLAATQVHREAEPRDHHIAAALADVRSMICPRNAQARILPARSLHEGPMPSIPEDIFTEPDDFSPDTLANLGPLRRLAGVWQSDQGVDVNPKAEGPERRVFREHIRMDPTDPQTNGPQLLYGLRYYIHINTPEEAITFHDQVGYWLWEPATGLIMQTIAIPRGQVVLAGGTAKPNDKRISVEARRGDTRFGICSTTFLEEAFRTDYYRIDITFNDDGSWTYVTRTDLAVRGKTPPFNHHDTNTLRRIAPPTPNPLVGLLKADKAR